MAKKKRKKRSTRVTKKKAGRRRGRRSNLSSASLADLQAELDRREQVVTELAARRDELLRELGEVERELKANGASANSLVRRRGPGRPRKITTAPRAAARRRGGRRPRNSANLVDSLHKVLKGKTMSVKDVTEAVQKAGYRTTSDNFRTIVNQALISNEDRFKKVDRGQYTAK